MKRVALLALLAAGVASAQADTFLDNARVRAVQPQYENVQVPREECQSQLVNEAIPVAAPPQQTNIGGTVLGAVVGGVLGNQVGKGHGKEAATAAGAVAGALVGNNVANGGYQQPPQYVQGQREVRSCHQVMEVQQRLTGYQVTYEYRGRDYQTVMRTQPGPVLPVQVSVVPVEGEYHRR